MKTLILTFLGILILNSVIACNNDSIGFYIKLIDSNLVKTERSETVNFDDLKLNSKYESQLLQYTYGFVMDTSLIKRKRAMEIVIAIGKKSKISTVRTQALNISLQTYNFPESNNFFNLFNFDDFNDTSKLYITRIYKREFSEMDLKMRRLYLEKNKKAILISLRASNLKDINKNITLDSQVINTYNIQLEREIFNWKNNSPMNREIIYLIGLLDMKELIPLLRNSLTDKKYYHPAIKIALARLGDKQFEKNIIDSVKSILLQSTLTSDLINPLTTLQYICTKPSIKSIEDIIPLKKELQPYSDGNKCKNIPIGFVVLKSLSEIIIDFPIKKNRDNLISWCYTMDEIPVNEYIKTALDWFKNHENGYELNKKFMVYPKYFK